MKHQSAAQGTDTEGLPDLLLAQMQQSVQHPTLDRGRNIRVGHLRGWGLEFGGLGERISADPLFASAVALSRRRGCLLTEAKLQNLFLIVKYCLEGTEGDIVEFGSYKGGSAVFMGALLRELGRPSRVFALDSYGGMPATDSVRDLHRQGDFSDAGLDAFREFLRLEELSDTVIPLEGRFEETFPGLAADIGDVSLVHIDCDIYTAVKYAIRASKPKLGRAGYLVFDDALHGSCLGAMQAIEEDLYHEENLVAEQVYPHLVFRYPPVGLSRSEPVSPLRQTHDGSGERLALSRRVRQVEEARADEAAQRDRAVRDRDRALSDREAALRERQAALTDRDAALNERQVARADRDMALLARDTALEVRRAAIAARDAALGARDDALADRDTALLHWSIAVGTAIDAFRSRDRARADLAAYESSILGGLLALGTGTRRSLIGLWARCRRILSLIAWRCGRFVLQAFPVEGRIRRGAKDRIYGALPAFFAGTPGYRSWVAENECRQGAGSPVATRPSSTMVTAAGRIDSGEGKSGAPTP